ncbi:MAG: hypothetical protein HYV97_18365 [Bdellovibrio sp.]|nr:hypothetical protein [Bdellovibrio sp.]
MAVKKKAPKKLKTTKLEERIAPGMVGGGLVDPGMAEPVDSSVEQQADEGSGEISQTEMDGESGNTAPEDGQYLQEPDSGTTAEYQEAPTEAQEPAPDSVPEMEAENNDEFYDDAAQGTVADEAPTWQEPDWVTPNADGSVTVAFPEGVTIDDGVANFPVDLANEQLPLPEGITITPEGGLEAQLPEGSSYSESLNAVILPEGSVPINDIPPEFNAYAGPDGSITVPLPQDGAVYDAEAGTVTFSNDWANELAPENIEIHDDGTVGVQLPENGVEYNADGTVTLAPEAGAYMDNPPPAYFTTLECAEFQPDGSMLVEPPEGIAVDGGVAFIEPGLVNELPFPPEVSFDGAGGMSYELPEGTNYNAEYNYLTVPADALPIDQVPDNFDAHVNPDQSLCVYLPEGVSYNEGSLEFNNEAANQVLPSSMNIDPSGQIQMIMPEETSYYEDGSFSIPGPEANFVEAYVPPYVDAPFVEAAPEGGYKFDLQQTDGCQCYPDGNYVEFNPEFAQEHFEDHMPEDTTFNPDGTMDMKLPEGFSFDPDANALTLPPGDIQPGDVPEGINVNFNPDGSATVYLPEGMQFNPETGSVHADNYWTNELMDHHDAPCEYSSTGQFQMSLPPDTEWHSDNSFTVPEDCNDFIENPAPDYMQGASDMFQGNPDGSYSFTPAPGATLDPTEGVCQCQTEYLHEHFDNYIPEDVHFNGDGTMNVDVPTAVYSPDANSLTFPAGEMHMNEIPEGMKAELLEDGSVKVYLPDGIEYNAETQQVQCDNYWTNELTPQSVEFSPDGQVQIQLPPDTQYYEGSCTIPEHQADFMENPGPEYVQQDGPDWAQSNPDGSVTITPPEGVVVDPAAGTVTFTYDQALEHLDSQIPDEIQLHADGSMDIGVPQGTTYDASANALNFPAGEVHSNDIPEGINYNINDDGSTTIYLADGMEWNAEGGTVHMNNAWVNQFAPEPIEIGTDGSFAIHLPPDTQYFGEQGFVISAENADFLDDHHDQYGEQQAPDSYQAGQPAA